MVSLHLGALTRTIQLAADSWFSMYKAKMPDWPPVPGTVAADMMEPTEDADWEALAHCAAEEPDAA
jgi:hypothetical protein